MKNNIYTMKIIDEIGVFCAEGRIGIEFMNNKVIPLLDKNECILMDFDGVRNMNSSFANALFSNLARKYGPEIVNRIKFLNIRDNVKKEIIGGLSLGLKNPNL